MDAFLSVSGMTWYHCDAPDQAYLDALVDKYDLHEIIEEDLEEKSTQDKIDVYDQCLFVVLHFPKYDTNRQKYLLNEFSIILGKDYIVTLTKYKTEHIQKIKQKYEEDIATRDSDEAFKISPYFILYRIMDVMYDKLLRGLRHFARDLRVIEEKIFDSHQLDKEVLEQVMLKRRNLVSLKHAILPQEEILKELQEETLKFFGGELDVYVEDLEYKIDKVLATVAILNENIESLYDTYNAMVNMRTNSIVNLLTIFTAVIGVLTLITGLYGMNVPLPGGDHAYAAIYIIIAMLFIVMVMFRFFRNKSWM